ncbi:hypothetical protein TraAM80_07466 [Trypanosoma rangeli]|uniref:Uncharacterized protein n=1 Tax=Trypanosoma rangeli TaxID=5698 RepID=A0A422N5J1_TRYRA|nr:uncharacterized protein TraAM80_07466 [Trypanosoma rangeli]RNF00692.1 hypothetical protein TraAM80_07466 [Trypanosoma rangeli]|eukprot:RNF00692.1 hypothetical protein TraAM80_07466 [Trypanosoma rangeli]
MQDNVANHVPPGGHCNTNSAHIDENVQNNIAAAPYEHHTHLPQAWRCLSVGCFGEAQRLSRAKKDIVCLAASLTMCGNTSMALKLLEAYIIASCVVAHEKRLYPVEPAGDYMQRLNQLIMGWMDGPTAAEEVMGASAQARDEEEYYAAVLDAIASLDWDTIHQWFIISLFLHEEGEYKPPSVLWFHFFFALFTEGTPKVVMADQSQPYSRKRQRQRQRQKILPEQFSHNELEYFLLSQCDESDVDLITTITAWKTQRYRSAIAAATRFLSVEEFNFSITDENMRVMTRFLRCMSLIELGERTIAAKDALDLLRDENYFISTVGASISAFLMPLSQAVKMVTSYEGETQLQDYVFALCEYVHALTLVQLGCMEAALKVLRCAISAASNHDVGDWMLNLMTIACTALEDSATLLKISLSPHRQLYISLCPAFFGGLGSEGAKLRPNTPASRLLYPTHLPTCASVRQMLPFHLNRSHYFFARGKYIEAWNNACLAVGCAEEIVGSVELAFTDCSPLKTYYFGCHLGFVLLQTVLEVMTLGDDTTSLGWDSDTANVLLKEGPTLCEEVLRKCAEWSRRLRQFHPNVRLGSVALSLDATMSRAENFISRAICLAWRYPRCALAQNCLTLALYATHHIPEAVDNATKALQTFPHSREIIKVYRQIVAKEGVYVFNYRTLVPVRYAPCSERLWTKRMLIVLLLLVLNFVVLILTVIVNIPTWVAPSETMKELSVRLHLPSVFPLCYAVFIIVYAVLATVSSRNLVRTIMLDLFFQDARMNRFLFCMRGIALVNAFNAIQLTIAGNNFLFASHWYTILLYLLLTFFLMPFTSRVWFIPSLDEPKDSVWKWLTLLVVDTVLTLLLLVPHIALFAVEPIMFIAFFFFQPVRQPNEGNTSGNLFWRLRCHKACRKQSISPYIEGKRTQFIHVRLLSLLYYKTHSDLRTKHLLDYQIDEDNYRIFPLIEVYDRIATEPIECLTRETKVTERRRHGVLEFLSTLRKPFGNVLLGEGKLQDDAQHHPAKATKNNHRSDFNGLLTDNPRAASGGGNDHVAENVRLETKGTSDEHFDTKDTRGSNCVQPTMSKQSDGPTIQGVLRKERQGNTRGGEVKLNDMVSSGVRRRRESNASLKGNSMGDDAKWTRNNQDNMFAPSSGCMTSQRVPQEAPPRAHAREYLSFSSDAPLTTVEGEYQMNPVKSLPPGTDERVNSRGGCATSIPGAKDTSETLRGRLPTLATAAHANQMSLVDELGEASNSYADPKVVSLEEEVLLRALRTLHRTLNSPLLDQGLHVTKVKQLQKQKHVVEERLREFYKINTNHLKQKSFGCLELCCKVISKIVETGDRESNPISAGNVSLIKTILDLLDAPEIFDTILLNELPVFCVVHGYTEMLSVILSPSCVQVMKYIHWDNLLRSFEEDTSSAGVESLHILLDSFQHVSSPSIKSKVAPLFQVALEAVLRTHASNTLPTEVENLLFRIKNDGNVKVDFWQVEGDGGGTVFSNTCATGNLELAEALWSLGLVPNLNRVQSDGTNALMQAVLHDRRDIVRWFCELPSTVTAESFTHRHPQRGTVFEIAQSGALRSMLRKAITKKERKNVER